MKLFNWEIRRVPQSYADEVYEQVIKGLERSHFKVLHLENCLTIKGFTGEEKTGIKNALKAEKKAILNYESQLDVLDKYYGN